MQANKISLAVNARDPNYEWLAQCLKSAKGFDETLLFIDGGHLDIVQGFNFVVAQTTGDWICSFCCDDYFIEDNLLEILDLMRSGAFDSWDVVHFPVRLNNGSTWGNVKNVTPARLRNENCLPHGSFFKYKVFHSIEGYRTEAATDWNFWLRAANNGMKFHYWDKPIYHFRKTSTGAYHRQLKKYGGISGVRQEVIDNV